MQRVWEKGLDCSCRTELGALRLPARRFHCCGTDEAAFVRECSVTGHQHLFILRQLPARCCIPPFSAFQMQTKAVLEKLSNARVTMENISHDELKETSYTGGQKSFVVKRLIPAGQAQQKYNNTFIVLLKTSIHPHTSHKWERGGNDGKDNGDAYYIKTKTDG